MWAGDAAPRAFRHEALLCEMLSQLNREARPEEWSRAVLPLITEALDMDTGAILRVTGDRDAQVLAAWGPTRKRGYPYQPLDLHDPLLGPLTQRSSTVMLDGSRRGQAQAALKSLCHPRFGTAVVASSYMGHALGGFVVLSRHRRESPSAEQVAMLTGITDAVGLALGTASLSRESSMSEVVLETACAVARAISGSLDLAQTFRQIAHSGARVMGECNCLLLEIDSDSGDLVAVACSDPADDVLIGLRVLFEDAPGNRDALAQRRSIVVEDVVWGAGADRAYRERLSIRTALFVPIHAEGGLIGSLLLYTTSRRDRYSDSDIARAETVAEQAASAICNARLFLDLERSESRATDLLHRITLLRERQRLTFANVLHDDIVQSIVAALFHVEGLRAATDVDKQEDLDVVAAMLKKSIADARAVIWDLRPPVLDGLGLTGALQALAQRLASDSGIEIQTELEGMPEVSPDMATALYVVTREALQNARKHARARHCHVALRRESVPGDAPSARLVISDDGCGFDLEGLSVADHFGLTMMDEQAALVGGALQLRTSPGSGTVVEVSVPLRDVE